MGQSTKCIEPIEKRHKNRSDLSTLSNVKTGRGQANSNEEMENFIIATCNQSEHLKFITESQCHFKGGDTVMVIDGPFKGVEGRVARVLGQQRVVISLTDVGLISTAYIPTAFLRMKNEKIIIMISAFDILPSR